MKNFIINIFLFIIMTALIVAIVIFGISIYTNVTDANPSDFVYVVNNISSNYDDKNENVSELNKNNEDTDIIIEEVKIDKNTGEKYYFNQLTDTQKEIYNGLFNNKENMYNGTYKIHYGGIFSDLLKEEGGNEQLGKDYQSAIEAFLYDNPDVFYIDANKLYLNVETTNSILRKTYNVYIGPAVNDTYYVDGFTTETQVRTAVNKINNVKNNIVNNLTGDDYKDILKIHDYLVNSIKYDENYKSIGSYSIYGALVDKRCVCEGYAKSLKYLLDEADIPCVIAQGVGENSSGERENHAWNIVCLDGEWYYIDATWDDPIILGQGTIAKSIQYKYFLKGKDTFNKDHIPSYRFSEGGKIFKYPAVQKFDYK